MTLLFRDSFDFYANTTDPGLNAWDTFNSGNTLVSGASTRFGTGQAVQIIGSAGAVMLSKTFSGNPSTFFWGSAVNPSGSFGASAITVVHRIFDGATVQCSWAFFNDGSIKFYRGDGNAGGTLLGSFAGGLSASAWNHYQIQAIIATGTSGEFHVRINGNTSDDFAITGVNTAASGAAQSSKFDIESTVNSPAVHYIYDDMALWSSAGSAPWNAFVGDMRAIQMMPNADAGTNNFTGNASPILITGSVVSSTQAFSANTLTTLGAAVQLPPGTLGSITVPFNATMTGNAIVALYDSDGVGGAPGTNLGNSGQITNPTGNQVFTFSSPPTLIGGHNYWLVMLANAAPTLKSNATTGQQEYTQALTYTATPGSWTLPVSTTSLRTVSYIASITPAGHYSYVQELLEDGAVTFLQDSTVNDKELFTSAGLPFTPSSILGVSVRGFVSKSDAGARSGCLTMTSGATVQDGATLALPTTFQNIIFPQDTDPNTGSAWTAANLNALKFGCKMVS